MTSRNADKYLTVELSEPRITYTNASSIRKSNPSLKRYFRNLSLLTFLKRITKVRQMDFELAVWQMMWLCVSPRKV